MAKIINISFIRAFLFQRFQENSSVICIL